MWLCTFLHWVVITCFILGLLVFFVRREFIRQLMGLKIMLQSVSLGMITAGFASGQMHLSQSVVISALIIEAIVIGLALTMIIHMKVENRKDGALSNRFFDEGDDA